MWEYHLLLRQCRHLNLSKSAQSAHVHYNLKIGSFISLYQLCDKDLYGDFQQKQSNDPGQAQTWWSVVCTRFRTTKPILCLDRTKRQQTDYYHASLGSPAKSILICSIRCTFLAFEQLSSPRIYPSIPSELGHKHQKAKHLWSTKFTTPINPHQPEPDILLPLESCSNIVHLDILS